MFVENDEEHKNVRNYQETIFLFTSWLTTPTWMNIRV
jgi:hypothetical protein